jgi:hypothetical protein
MNEQFEIFLKRISWAEGSGAIREKDLSRSKRYLLASLYRKYCSSFQRLESYLKPRVGVRRDGKSGRKTEEYYLGSLAIEEGYVNVFIFRKQLDIFEYLLFHGSLLHFRHRT